MKYAQHVAPGKIYPIPTALDVADAFLIDFFIQIYSKYVSQNIILKNIFFMFY
jgi:hypothetical protein